MSPGPEDRPDRDQDLDDGLSEFARGMRKAGPFLTMGWSIAISVALGTFAGYWLDNKFGTTPWLLIVGALLGIAAGFVELVRTVKKLS